MFQEILHSFGLRLSTTLFLKEGEALPPPSENDFSSCQGDEDYRLDASRDGRNGNSDAPYPQES